MKRIISESTMSTLDILTQESETWQDFVKKVTEEFPELKNSKSLKWLKDTYFASKRKDKILREIINEEIQTVIEELKKEKDEVIKLYKKGFSQAEISDKLGIDFDKVVSWTKHLGHLVGKSKKDWDDRVGDDPPSKQYYGRTIKR